MPIYEYECGRRHRFELRQSFSAEPVATCPSCETTARRVIHVVPVHFKGSGFYVNDYGRKAAATESGKTDSATEPAAAKPVAEAAKEGPKEATSKGDKETAKAAGES